MFAHFTVIKTRNALAKTQFSEQQLLESSNMSIFPMRFYCLNRSVQTVTNTDIFCSSFKSTATEGALFFSLALRIYQRTRSLFVCLVHSGKAGSKTRAAFRNASAHNAQRIHLNDPVYCWLARKGSAVFGVISE